MALLFSRYEVKDAQFEQLHPRVDSGTDRGGEFVGRKIGKKAAKLVRSIRDFKTPAAKKAHTIYADRGAELNRRLRSGEATDVRFGSSGTGTEAIDGLDAMFADSRSRLTEPVTLYRGVLEPGKVWGGRFTYGGNNTGLTWDDPGFLSTTTREDIAEGFAFWGDGMPGDYHYRPTDAAPVIVKVHVPAGTPALKLDGRAETESEILLPRGYRYRIVADHGRTDNGPHEIEVELVGPADDEAKAAPKAKPADDAAADTLPRWIDSGPAVKTRPGRDFKAMNLLRRRTFREELVNRDRRGRFAEEPGALFAPGDVVHSLADLRPDYRPGHWQAVSHAARVEAGARALYDGAVAEHGQAAIDQHYGSWEQFLETARPHVEADLPDDGEELLIVNGPHRIIVQTNRPTDAQRTLALVDDLLTSNPPDQPLTLHLKKQEDMVHAEGATYGEAFRSEGTLWISDEVYQSSKPTGAYRSFMPAAKAVPFGIYTIVHEWGHLIDRRTLKSLALTDLLQRRFKWLSPYGRKNLLEAYGELYAQWYLTGGKTKNPVAQSWARKYGWKAGTIDWTA